MFVVKHSEFACQRISLYKNYQFCACIIVSFFLAFFSVAAFIFFIFVVVVLTVIHYFIHQIFSLLPFCLFACSKRPVAFISRSDCSGAVTILPTILHLTTSVARELAARTAETKAPTVISACLQSLKLLCTHEMMKEEAVAADWLRLLQSAVATLLHYGKPGQCLWAFQSVGRSFRKQMGGGGGGGCLQSVCFSREIACFCTG